MKQLLNSASVPVRGKTLKGSLATLMAAPFSNQAGVGTAPVQMSMTSYLLIAFLLVFSLIMFFIFQRRFIKKDMELQDITNELENTRSRLSNTGKELDLTQRDLKETKDLYQGILFDACVGMFQIDLDGSCIYINSAMQEMSGLYLKKAQNEGFSSAVHPDDRARFNAAWKQFIDGNEPFSLDFRFQLKKGRKTKSVHVFCKASRVLNAKKQVESYIGWVSDITNYHERELRQQAETARYSHFVSKTHEAYYQLKPEEPIPLSSTTSEITNAIMGKMALVHCNDTFAAMYGTEAEELVGKSIQDLSGGCGPFRKDQDLVKFAESGYQLTNLESVRQDANGSRLNLSNDVIGIVEDNKLVCIWGAQRNITKEKREKAELKSQVSFMHRILDSLPADVHVKDTRCRYLYASKKLADRTGIPKEEWIGKTIYEVIPGTSHSHDHQTIETMKSGKLTKNERHYEVRGKSGWMETVQIPLVSNEGVVEGVAGLSIDITARKQREEDEHQKRMRTEDLLETTRQDLNTAREETRHIEANLAEATEQLNQAETEKRDREQQFKEHIAERKQTEAMLRQNEKALQLRQQELEEQLTQQLARLDDETDKRKKWEELLAIREKELGKLEKLSADLGQQLAETEDFLKNTQEQLTQISAQHAAEMKKETSARMNATEELNRVRQQLEQSDAKLEKKIEVLTAQHQSELSGEHSQRVSAEKQLAKIDKLLKKTQAEMKELSERHSKELETEVAERKAAAEKLIKNMEELDELRQQFNHRLDEETKTIKHELAQKQIREKALRQHEQNLEERIKELEGMLQMKAEEFSEQIQAREGAELQKQQIEKRLEQMTQRQQELVARETQRLQLHIAEIRLQEVKLRKEAGDLQREKESLESLLHARDGELKNASQQLQGTQARLDETKSQLKKLSDNQEQLIKAETEAMHRQLNEVKQHGEELQNNLNQLLQDKRALETKLKERDSELEMARKERDRIDTALTASKEKLQDLTENQASMLDAETQKLHKQLEQMNATCEQHRKHVDQLQHEKQDIEQSLETRTQELSKAAREYHKVVDAYRASQSKLKELAESQEAALAHKTQALQEELKQQKQIRTELLSKGGKLEEHIEKQQSRIEELNAKLQKETAKGAQAEKSLQELRSSFENDLKNTEALGQEQAKSLRNQIDQWAKNEESLRQALEQAQTQIHERDDALASMKSEYKQVEDRIQELEQRLAGIHKEHQAELKKSMAEVKQISQMNSELVDELNDTLQSALNPVVKTTILLEKADNLSQEQKQEMATANLSCRRLIDVMNYRSELTHIADGSDALKIDHCDLHGLMTDMDRQFCHRAETKKLFFAVSFAQYQATHNVPKHVETDELKVRKVLSILLGYAVEQTDKGRLGLHATRNSSSENSTVISFELAYTGKETHDKLLNSIFGDGEEEDVLDVKYGLTLARRYICMLDGDYTLEYRSGDVTALTIRFPFRKAGGIASSGEDEEEAGAA